jgi:hypothetical protein
MATEHLSEAEALRADLEMTRQHLADTVQELTRQLNVPRRIKEPAIAPYRLRVTPVRRPRSPRPGWANGPSTCTCRSG